MFPVLDPHPHLFELALRFCLHDIHVLKGFPQPDVEEVSLAGLITWFDGVPVEDAVRFLGDVGHDPLTVPAYLLEFHGPHDITEGTVQTLLITFSVDKSGGWTQKRVTLMTRRRADVR